MAKPAADSSSADALLHQLLTETDERAVAALFVTLCRESAELRQWLWEDFASDPRTRERFAARLRAKSKPVVRVAELGDDSAAWAQEVAQLRHRFSARIYGGLTWREVETLIGKLRAGRVDVGVFLLALEWRRAGPRALRSAALQRAGVAWLHDLLVDGNRTRLAQLTTALDLVDACGSQPQRAVVGYADWWKLQLLLHILRHPRESYRTRELHAHLASLGLRVDTKEIRRFCARHGIRRDMRGGRPRNAPREAPRRSASPEPAKALRVRR
jgi:hypothetical protein